MSQQPPGNTPSTMPPSPEDIAELEAKVAEVEQVLEVATLRHDVREHLEELVKAARHLIRRARGQLTIPGDV